MLREGLRLVENREVEEATKLETLRAAAQLGVSALERGEFKEFPNGLALLSHLNKIADKVVSRPVDFIFDNQMEKSSGRGTIDGNALAGSPR